MRPWEPGDAAALKEAIDSSLEHLRTYLPWAHHEPETLTAKVERLRRFRGDFDLDRDYVYGLLDPASGRALGGCGLHRRAEEGALEIGYWIRVDAAGQGLITEAAAALTRLGFEVHGVARLEIRCDPRNAASAAVAGKLGYQHEATLRGRDLDPSWAPRDTSIWSLFRDGYPSSGASKAEVAAFDVLGVRLL
jgi:RimJ/RimL family protein N-acetyltransferase